MTNPTFQIIDNPNDFERQPVYYNALSKVYNIFNLLDTISIDKFQNNFDHNELNVAGIYPSDIWNDETEENIAFNVSHMTVEFEKLKLIFKTAKENDEYLLSYVG